MVSKAEMRDSTLKKVLTNWQMYTESTSKLPFWHMVQTSHSCTVVELHDQRGCWFWTELKSCFFFFFFSVWYQLCITEIQGFVFHPKSLQLTLRKYTDKCWNARDEAIESLENMLNFSFVPCCRGQMAAQILNISECAHSWLPSADVWIYISKFLTNHTHCGMITAVW